MSSVKISSQRFVILYAKGQWLEDIKDTLDAYLKINAEYKMYLFSKSFSYILIWLFYIKKNLLCDIGYYRI